MAEVMRKSGVPGVFTQQGSVADIVKTLQSGQNVPLGVGSISGTMMTNTNSQNHG